MVDLEDMSFLLLICKAKKGVKRIQRGCFGESSSDSKVRFFLSYVLCLCVMNHVPVFVVCEPFIDGTHKGGDDDQAEDLGSGRNRRRS
jgi:hypothetical protein